MSATAHQRTFRGRSLAELLPQIREELGEGAVAVSVRHGRTGGVGGFFAQSCVEVDAVPGEDMNAEFARLLAAAGGEAPPAAERFVPMPAQATASAPVAPMPVAARDDAAAKLAALFQPDAAPMPMPAPAAPAAPMAPAPAAHPAPLIPTDLGWPNAALDIQRTLTGRGMDPDLVAAIVGEAVDHLLPFSSEASLRPLVAGQLARCLPPLPRRRAGRRLAIGFVGAGGAGKSRCVSRLALAYAGRRDQGGRPVYCLTLRPRDRGAELLAAVSSSGIPVHAAADGADARAFLDSLSQDAVVVVDTPGVSPRAEAELRQLAAELRQLQLDECHLTLPATLSPAAAGELVHGTHSLRVDALALTHVDEIEHLGTAIAAAISAELPISYVGRGPHVRGGLRPALVEALALELVG